MPTRGQVVLGADTLRVAGASWLDREWSTSALPEGVVGWDWFALQLDNGWDLMVYALRRDAGTAHPLSDGVLVDPSGGRHPLDYGTDITIVSTGTWKSPLDGSVYPSGWSVTLPGRGWSLEVLPVLESQELDLAFRYWEGAVTVSGTDGAGALGGRGYVELTGYAGARPER
jgi:predicted secreted hydrolase